MSITDEPVVGSLRVLHLCLASFYVDGYTYQENLLPKYHQKAGHEVEIIASLVTFNSTGELALLEGPRTYQNENGIKVTRLAYWPGRFASRLRVYRGLISAIQKFEPDVIFAHGPQFLDALRVVLYTRRNPTVRLFVDNHADHVNSGHGYVSRTLLHKGLWRATAQMLARASDRMFGVLPARVDFLTDVYKVPKAKVSFLPLGADDDLLQSVTPSSVADFREQHGIAPNELLIVTGGKIDHHKPGTFNLMRAANALSGRGVHLIVFGTVIPDFRDEFESLLESTPVKFLGWLDDARSTLCFSAADLVIFPGHHSVYWEQVCAIGKPLMVTVGDAKPHMELGGNCRYLPSDCEEDIEEALRALLDQPELLESMTTAAQSPKRLKFSYRAIAEQAIGRDAL